MTRSARWLRFIETLRIRTRDRRIARLVYNAPQRKLWAVVAPQIDAGAPIRLIVLKARREGVCLAPSTRILTAALTWKPLDEIQPGDTLVSVDEHAHRRGRGRTRKMREAIVEHRREVVEPAFRLSMDDGRMLIATGPHRFLCLQRGGTLTQWRAVSRLRGGDSIRTMTEPWGPSGYEDGWFGGLLDGEGTIRGKWRAGCEITITQLPGAVYDRAVRYLKDRDYHVRQSMDWYPNSHPRDGYHRKPIGRITLGRTNELLRVVGQTQPSRVPATWWQGKDLPGKRSGVAWQRVGEIEPLGVRPMIDLQTSTGTFIAEGFVSHNSTQIESWLMTLIASGDLVNALVTAHIAKASRRIWNMSKFFVRSSPLLTRLARMDRNQIAVGRSTLEIATAGSPESERSGDLTAWHASEAAFYPHPEVMLATMQALPHRRDIFSIGVIESTPNGRVGDGELFYTEWQRAVEGDSEWRAVFLGWQDFEEYQLPGIAIEQPDAEEGALRERFEVTDAQLAWRRWAIANLCQGDLDKFHQEYAATAEECFIQSGLPFFRTEHLLPLERDLRSGQRGSVDADGRFARAATGPVEVFQLPQPGHQYVIGADSSMGLEDGERGRSHSRSAAEVLDMDTVEQVAEYDAVSAPHLFARHLAGLSRMYGDALVAPEVQSSGGGGGRELIVYLRDLGCWNLHRWRHMDRIQRDHGTLYGWETNARTRPRMLSRIREVVMERSAVIHSRRLMNQLSAFGESDSGRMEALAGHDDLLFAWGIALMSRSENYFKLIDTPAVPMAAPDWEALGLHVLNPEAPWDRLRRLLALQAREPRERGFLEL